MAMSRKQYHDMAAVIADEVGDIPLTRDSVASFDDASAIYNIASGLATVFAIDNPRFDRQRFMTACNIEE
jgi:hypothetical protein